MRRLTARQLALIVAIATASVAFPLGVVASHQFTDVPTSSTYHGHIDAIADAGITTGCAAGKYCPKDFVTREQMAAFLNRLGALGPGTTPVVNADKVDGLTSGQFVRSDVATAGRTGCAGNMMQPWDSTVEWDTNDAYIYPISGIFDFTCQLHLPNGATLTAFTAYFHDDATTKSGSCRLIRAPWATGVFEYISPQIATPVEGELGRETVSTTSFTDATVNNAQYHYASRCSIPEYSGTLGLFGVTLAYTIAGSPEE